MKNLKYVLVYTVLTFGLLASSSYTGMTGGIDFPSAYILINKNYTVSGMFSSLNEDIVGDVVIETGLIPQVEAGLKVTTLNGDFDQNFLQANVKFQVVSEGNGNPAISIGFTEFDTYSIQADQEEEKGTSTSNAYVFLVLSKHLSIQKLDMESSIGVTYSQIEEEGKANLYGIVELPILEKITILTEAYTYDKGSKKAGSVNLGAEFLTRENFRTKVFWRERNDSFGVAINFIGLFEK